MTGLHSVSWLRELERLLRRYGVLCLTRRAVAKAWRHLFRNRNRVFVYEPSGYLPAAREDVTIWRMEAMAAIPEVILRQLSEQLGDRYLRAAGCEFRMRGILYVALAGEVVAAVQWSRIASDIDTWFTSLEREDVVIFGGTTLPAFRGRGIMPWMIQHQANLDGKPGRRVLADCKVWNTPARKAIEKAGFHFMGTYPSLRVHHP